MPTAQEMEMARGLSPEDKKRVGAMIRNGRNPGEALRSVVDQNDAYEREQPNAKEEMGARALAAADSVSPSPLALMMTGPPGLVTAGAIEGARALAGTDQAIEEAKEIAPAAYSEGEVATTLASLAGGIGGGAAKIAGRVGGAAKNSAVARRASGAAKDAGAELANKIPGLRALKKLVGHGGDVTDDMIVAADDLPLPEATKSPVPDLGKSGLRRVYEELVAKADAPAKSAADDVDYAKAADDFDPGGEAWKAWHEGVTPTSAVKAVEKGKVQVAGTKVDRTPAKGGDLRAEAIERIGVDDVGSAVPKTPPGPSAKPPDGNAFLAAEEARIAQEAERAWRSLPPAPTPKPVGAPLSDAALRAEVRAAVARGEPLKALAKRLGLPQGDISTMFKAAQIGN